MQGDSGAAAPPPARRSATRWISPTPGRNARTSPSVRWRASRTPRATYPSRSRGSAWRYSSRPEAAALGAHHGAPRRPPRAPHPCAYDHDPEVRPHLGADALGQGEDQILQVPLVELIENEASMPSRKVLLEAAEQDPLGAEHPRESARKRRSSAPTSRPPGPPSIPARPPPGGPLRAPPACAAQDPYRTLAPCQRRGTRVVLPAPGSATSTQAPASASAASSAGRTSSTGRGCTPAA